MRSKFTVIQFSLQQGLCTSTLKAQWGGRYFLRPRDDTKALNKVCKIVQEQSVANFHGEEADVKVFDQKREKRNKSLRFKIVKTHREWSEHSSGPSSHKVTYTYLPLSDSD